MRKMSKNDGGHGSTVKAPSRGAGLATLPTGLECLCQLLNHVSFGTRFTAGTGMERNGCHHAKSFALISTESLHFLRDAVTVHGLPKSPFAPRK